MNLNMSTRNNSKRNNNNNAWQNSIDKVKKFKFIKFILDVWIGLFK